MASALRIRDRGEREGPEGARLGDDWRDPGRHRKLQGVAELRSRHLNF